jgi:hypothetical protein
MELFGVLYLIFWVAAVALVIGIAIWGFIFWDRRYRGAQGRADQFQPTDETFRDPTTGRMMRVFFNASTGERQYRETS